jgi:hypothetical protein
MTLSITAQVHYAEFHNTQRSKFFIVMLNVVILSVVVLSVVAPQDLVKALKDFNRANVSAF